MNEKDRQAKRNASARLLRFTSRHHVNCCRLNVNNTLKHELFKALECYNLRKQGHDFITEAEWEKGGRADILDLDLMEAVEIAVSESDESLELKKKAYPVPVRVVRP